MTTTPKKYSGRIRHSTFVDLTGTRIGRSVVLREALGDHGCGTRWVLRCPCGSTFEMHTTTIRKHAQNGVDLVCHDCRPRRPGPSRVVRFTSCTECGEPGHNRKSCPRRPRAKQKRCATCEGMPWRRETPRCRGCGKPHGPEPKARVEVIRDERTWP